MMIDLRSDSQMLAYYKKTYEPRNMDIIKFLLEADSCLVDVGANIGFYTVAIAAALKVKKGSGKVIAFEPVEVELQTTFRKYLTKQA